MKDYQTISVEWSKPVLKVAFNRPEKANAMNKQMNEELDSIITEVRKDTDYKFIVFTGNGKAFSAGADMNEVLQGIENNSFSRSFIREDQLSRQEFLRKFDSLDQITIAAINGPMYGAGLALAMVCDFRIMADHATACLPEVERGLFFSGGGTPRLVNLIGPAKAKEFIMLCDAIDATEALKIGLVNKVVPLQDLAAATEELIGKLNRSPFSPIRLTKKIVNAATPRFENLLFYEPELQEQMMLYGEAREEINKFVSSKKK
ncbi:enoyl-CoA hydratase/isomerase family protein [Neobacillus niacini]|uniref:enoyl-CoA hydratase/isomerase family protein n=1 Tax=Neobacillus niacini TaxID=86668 RepID=UPI0021CB9105|nr:enoyl-CoA hydratase/isomerase family protein [Neobacillus niacini]MCM3766109.1 enoyl-CoA hydratase/isomerase family protein [Neobacillus niacini]